MTRQRIVLLVVAGVLVWGWSSIVAPARVLAQTLSFELIGSLPGPADLVELQDGLAYISADKEFTVFDMSDPTEPKRLGGHTFPEQIWGFRLAGDRAYVGANFFGLGILDISERGAPTLLGVYKSLGQTKIGAVVGGTVALIDHMAGLVFANVSDEAAPQPIGSYYLDGYARDVVVSGSIAYAVDSPTGLYVFDLTGQGPWEPVGILHAPSAPQRSLEVFDLPGTPGARILCGVGAGGVQIYDVSDPAAPMKLVSYDTPGQAGGLTIDGSLAYVADGSAGLQVLDLSTPSAPTVVAGFRTERPARDVAVAGSIVIMVVGDSEYQGHDREVLILRQIS
ncbi:MAG: hypothetical protein V3T48_08235 [Vicinamibacterales bacterium]